MLFDESVFDEIEGVRRISMIQVEIYVFQAGEGDSFLVTVKDGKRK